MPTKPIDPMTGPKYVLEGKIVTMGPQGVVPRGAIYIDAGEIKAVQGSRKAPPPGFEDALRIRTGDTIYPGLIELHNHLCYNAMPLWDVPKRYTNNGQWKTHEDYRRLVTKPSQVLGRSNGIVEALVRFVECKCLLGIALLVSLLSGCGTLPKQEVRSYVDAFAQVRKTADAVLNQYEKDIETRTQDANTPADEKPIRYPSELPVVTIATQSRTSNPDVIVRRAPLEQVDQYHNLLVAIAENQPFTQTHQLANQLYASLKRGLQVAGPTIGIPSEILDMIVKAIKTAKTRAELIRALRAAKISQEAYDALMVQNSDAQSQEVLKDPAKVKCHDKLQVTCIPLITIMLELMQKDVDNFFAARQGVVLIRRKNEIADPLGKLRRKINSYLEDRKKPTEGALARDFISAEQEFNTVLKEILEDQYIPFSFPSKPNGLAYTEESQNIVNLYLAAAQELNQKDVVLGASLQDYVVALTQYRSLLIKTNQYFLAIEAALERAPDLIGIDNRGASVIVPLANNLINGAVDVRGALAALLFTE